MTKKDYELIARVIKEINTRKAKGQRIVELFGLELEKENPRFDYKKFYLACEISEFEQ